MKETTQLVGRGQYWVRRDVYQHSLQERSFVIRAVLFLLLHIPIALLFQWNNIIVTGHALLTLSLGIYWLVKDQKPVRVIYVIVYISGAELLWRGLDASVFYEYGKYSTSLLLLLLLLKYGGINNADKRGLIYFILLLPAILVLPQFDRELISFNLAGPFVLALAVTFFSKVKMTFYHLGRLCIAILAPVIGLGFLASYGTLTVETIQFTGVSIRATSAGIGPNQVSSVLGLGVMMALLYVMYEKKHGGFRLFLGGVAGWLLIQIMLTFSRGGLWTTIGALFVFGFYLLQDRRSRVYLLLLSVSVLLVNYLILPMLDNFTGGTLENRIRDFDLTNRDKIMQADLLAFKDEPIFGVGPGRSDYYHSILFRVSSAHTEYTRLLAEHGIFGLAALMILLSICVKRFFLPVSFQQKAIITAFTTWTLLFMFHSATRLVAPSLLFGLSSASISLENDKLSKQNG